MAHRDMTYCNGRGCALRWQCLRYTEGRRIVYDMHDDTSRYRWMDHCDVNTRECYMKDES